MIIDVSKDNLSLINGNLIHTGEYKVNEVIFNFSDEYTETTNKAVFTNCLGSYEVPIIDGRCDIPNEVLKDQEIITLGVYGYKLENDEYILRYSPSPIDIKIIKGSYVEGAENGEVITPTQFEIYTQSMNEGLKKVDATIGYMQEIAEEVSSKGNEAEEKALLAQNVSDEIIRKADEGEFDGATFIPNVDEEGNISWENNKQLENPETVNIRGPKGQEGKAGEAGKNATINGLEAINIVGGQNIDLIQQGSDFYISYNGTEMNVEVVETLPSEGVSNKIYLVLKETGTEEDIYDEYLFINGVWEHIGNTAIDLSNYYTKNEVNELIENIDVSLPVATTDILGGIKKGTNIDISEDGTFDGFTNLKILVPDFSGFSSASTPNDSQILKDLFGSFNATIFSDKGHSSSLWISSSSHSIQVLYEFTLNGFNVYRRNSKDANFTEIVLPGTEKYVREYVGSKSGLQTTVKDNIVNAINEVKTNIDTLNTNLGTVNEVLATLTTVSEGV